MQMDTQLYYSFNVRDIKQLDCLVFIMRNCKLFTNLETLKLLYYSYVKSKLEYKATICNIHYQNPKSSIEQNTEIL